MRIGIELETLCDSTPTNGVGDYHDGLSVEELPTIAGSSWCAENDSSLSPADGERGIEFVSPTFAFNEANISKLFTSVATIKNEFGARTNRSCGCHVNVSLPELSPQQYRRLYFIGRLFQQGMYASTGSVTRESGSYATPLREIPYSGEDSINEGYFGNEDRCSWLNCCHIRKHTKLTQHNSRCEYRVFSGTTDALRVIAWSQLAIGFTHYAVDTNAPLPVLPIARPKGVGEGRYNLDCLLESIGWLDGTTQHWVNNCAMSLKDGVKIVQDLATLYDAKKYGSDRVHGGVL